MTGNQFGAPAEHYDRFMGRYTPSLATALIDAVGLVPPAQAVDVGCGPGGLTGELVARLGGDAVAAVDPQSMFVAACRERYPSADVRQGTAEDLPWADDSFDAALACLVIGFMSDPDAGLAEMARVTRPGGTVAACMWDIAGGRMTMLRIFWDAVRATGSETAGERALAGTSQGDIAERMRRAGLADVTESTLEARADYRDFDDFWEPFTYGVGPAGAFLDAMGNEHRARVREACRAVVGTDGAFTLDATAWFARGTVPVSG